MRRRLSKLYIAPVRIKSHSNHTIFQFYFVCKLHPTRKLANCQELSGLQQTVSASVNLTVSSRCENDQHGQHSGFV